MKKNLLLTIMTLLSYCSVWAWGGQGHSTVAHIAERHITKRAKANIESYIGGKSIVYYAAWMDYVRQFEPYVVTTNWHVDYWTNDERTDSEGRPMPPNHVSQINRIVADMKDDFRSLPDSLVTINIKFLTHLVGDMHCPVHIDFPQSRPMWYMVNGARTRFHKMWDGAVISDKHKGCSPIQLAEEFDILTPEQIAEVQKGTPMDWHNENIIGARRAMEMVPADGVLTEEYFDEAIVIAEDRLTRAGYRLAAILNSIFDK